MALSSQKTDSTLETMIARARSEIGKQGAAARNNGMTPEQRKAAAHPGSAAGVAARKACEHPESRREIACSFCNRTLERMSDGRMTRIKHLHLIANDEAPPMLACVEARMKCKHPKSRRRTICGFCRRPLEAK